MIVFRVYYDSYDGGATLGVFTDEQSAIDFARNQARTTNEEFTGNTGYGVGIERLDPVTGQFEHLDDWADWKIKIEGAHFVVDESD